MTPEPYFLRQLIKDLQRLDKHKLAGYFDFLAHSGRKSIFMYGPYFRLHSSKYMKIRTIPKLISERTEMFRFFSCRFRIEKYKENWDKIYEVIFHGTSYLLSINSLINSEYCESLI